jgi:hypothetical protein
MRLHRGLALAHDWQINVRQGRRPPGQQEATHAQGELHMKHRECGRSVRIASHLDPTLFHVGDGLTPMNLRPFVDKATQALTEATNSGDSSQFHSMFAPGGTIHFVQLGSTLKYEAIRETLDSVAANLQALGMTRAEQDITAFCQNGLVTFSEWEFRAYSGTKVLMQRAGVHIYEWTPDGKVSRLRIHSEPVLVQQLTVRRPDAHELKGPVRVPES